MILKADKIAHLLDVGRESNHHDPLVITPAPDTEKLAKSGSTSIDLRLGTWFMTLKPARIGHLSTKNSGSDYKLLHTEYVKFGDEYILHPRSFVLSATLEWLRLPSNLAAYVIGKSSWGRRGLVIATATGVHPGYKGCLTLELSNLGELPIAIKPGTTVCQLFFHKVDTSDSKNVDKSQFVMSRKPSLGSVDTSDEIAQSLFSA